MRESSVPTGIEVRHERTESARLDNFVDGAFAFAITLLVISGASLPRNVAALEHALRGIPAFAACFAQLALFWHGHVRWRDVVRLTDGPSLRLSLLLVFFALIFVFPLNMAYGGFLSSISGGALSPDFAAEAPSVRGIAALFVCFGLSYTCMAGTLALLFRHGVRKARLSREDAILARVNLLLWSACAATGLLSTIAALFAAATQIGGLIPVSGFIYGLLGFSGTLMRRYRKLLEGALPA